MYIVFYQALPHNPSYTVVSCEICNLIMLGSWWLSFPYTDHLADSVAEGNLINDPWVYGTMG